MWHVCTVFWHFLLPLQDYQWLSFKLPWQPLYSLNSSASVFKLLNHQLEPSTSKRIALSRNQQHQGLSPMSLIGNCVTRLCNSYQSWWYHSYDSKLTLHTSVLEDSMSICLRPTWTRPTWTTRASNFTSVTDCTFNLGEQICACSIEIYGSMYCSQVFQSWTIAHATYRSRKSQCIPLSVYILNGLHKVFAVLPKISLIVYPPALMKWHQ